MKAVLMSAVAGAFTSAVALAQEGNLVAPASQGQQPPGWLTPAWLIGMFFFFWLFIFRPQAKRQKEHKAFLENLQVGTEVVTSGGIIGKVSSVNGNIVTVDLGHGNVRVLKSAISAKLDPNVTVLPAT